MSTQVVVKDENKKDKVFATTAVRGSDFEFNAEVAEVFDDMLVRSVPFYIEQKSIIEQIARKFYIPGTRVYDLGCSTGVTLANIAKALGPEVSMVGYDYSQPMLDKAQRNIAQMGLGKQIELRHADFNKDLSQKELEKGGVLICMEKVLTNSSDMNRYFIEFYYDYKSRHGYSREEILRKREALENVLVPYRTDENFELFRRNGFGAVETCFQWFNFAAYLCVKGA